MDTAKQSSPGPSSPLGLLRKATQTQVDHAAHAACTQLVCALSLPTNSSTTPSTMLLIHKSSLEGRDPGNTYPWKQRSPLPPSTQGRGLPAHLIRPVPTGVTVCGHDDHLLEVRNLWSRHSRKNQAKEVSEIPTAPVLPEALQELSGKS